MWSRTATSCYSGSMSDPATDHTLAFIQSALTAGARNILEIGCGQGALAARLMAEGFDVVAIDSDAACVAAARARGVDARVATWPETIDRRFDAILFTRSLHHIPDLDGSVAAALECLTQGGRIVIEDFNAAYRDPPSEGWVRGIARALSAAGVAFDPGSWIAEQLQDQSSPGPDDHHHELHSAARIEATCARLGSVLSAEPAAYFFRYFQAASLRADAIAAAMLAHECDAIAKGWIAPLGRRLVVGRGAGVGAMPHA